MDLLTYLHVQAIKSDVWQVSHINRQISVTSEVANHMQDTNLHIKISKAGCQSRDNI